MEEIFKNVDGFEIGMSILDNFTAVVKQIEESDDNDALTEVVLVNKYTKEKKEIYVNTVQGKLLKVLFADGFVWYHVKKINKFETITKLKLNAKGEKIIHAKKSCKFKGCALSVEYSKENPERLCVSHKNDEKATTKRVPLVVQNIDQSENPSVGSATEEYIVDMLKSCTEIKSVEWVAGINGPFDILYTLNDGIRRGLQIKTLTEHTFQNTYEIDRGKKLYDDLLYVCVNKNRTRFIVIFGKHLGKHGATFNFDSVRSKYKKFIFSTFETFKNLLLLSLKDSTVVTEQVFENSLAAPQLLEYQSIKRFDEKCKERNWNVIRCPYSQLAYDVTVNNKKIQCKFSSEKESLKIRFHLSKTVNGEMHQPYEKGDFDFVMLESSHDKGNFYIIPQSELIKREYMKTKKFSGKSRLSVLNKADYQNDDRDDWTDAYYNKFDLLK